MGIVTGSMLVNGKPRDQSFQRKTGYVQQQDLHLDTSTVREALKFSALLRQPARYTRQEKLEYVDTVIEMLDMEEYADAIVGVEGEGLNVEQRKRLTIGVELAARPALLVFRTLCRANWCIDVMLIMMKWTNQRQDSTAKLHGRSST